jgi:hypothetical protein
MRVIALFFTKLTIIGGIHPLGSYKGENSVIVRNRSALDCTARRPYRLFNGGQSATTRRGREMVQNATDSSLERRSEWDLLVVDALSVDGNDSIVQLLVTTNRHELAIGDYKSINTRNCESLAWIE